MIEQFTLECIEGKRRGRSYTLPGCGCFEIGRRRDKHIPVPDGTVSADHCTITADGRDLWLRDNNSTNGTEVGGQRVTEVLLQNGDVITLGGCCRLRLKIQYGISPDAEDLISSIANTVALGGVGEERH